MNISLHHEWRLVHMLALALILMAALSAALTFLPLPNFFFENTLTFLAIVPYVLLILPFESAMQDPRALPTLDLIFMGVYALVALVIYTFFFAIVAAVVSRNKIIPITYVGLYSVLALAFSKIFDHLL